MPRFEEGRAAFWLAAHRRPQSDGVADAGGKCHDLGWIDHTEDPRTRFIFAFPGMPWCLPSGWRQLRLPSLRIERRDEGW